MENNNILGEILRVRSIAEIGLLYCSNEYDQDRFNELIDISFKLMSKVSDHDIELLKAYFPLAKEYPTAKVDIRAFLLSADDRILLVRERVDNKWSLPGGWADIGYSPAETVVKECKEETGLDVVVLRLLALFDKKMHDHPSHVNYVYKMVFYCKAISDTITPGFDLLDAQYFPMDELPELSEDRILESQLRLLYNKVTAGDHATYFD